MPFLPVFGIFEAETPLESRPAIRATTQAQPIQLDGDEFGEAVSLNTHVEPGGLLVAVPKGHQTGTL